MGCCFTRARKITPQKRKKLATVQRARDKTFEKAEQQIVKSAINVECKEPVLFENMEAYKIEMLGRKLSDLDKEALLIDAGEVVFPFENLIFEGGGNKGIAYVGVIKFLEEKNLMHQIKRYAGSSAGAIVATLVAIGYNYHDLFTFLSQNLKPLFLDHRCGIISLLPNLLRSFGWNPGNKIYDWFGEKIRAKTRDDNPDYTFFELWQDRGIELCIVVTNVNLMSAQYCHVKTTPDMPIREALRMTMSIPVVFSAIQYEGHGRNDVYVDGGVLCNYPIHCFDGWYLSMKESDAFLKRFQTLKEIPMMMLNKNRFGGSKNSKSLGFLLFSDDEEEVLRYSLEKRRGMLIPSRPKGDTKLYKKRQKEKAILEMAEKTRRQVVEAVEAFMEVLHKHELKDHQYVCKTELMKAFQDTDTFTREHASLLFGEGFNVNKAFTELDLDGNGRISVAELIHFVEERDVRMWTRFVGYQRREVNNFFDFLVALQNSLLTNMKYVFVGESDVDRTVGINTGHITTNDYKLEPADRQFAVDRGYNATETYLRYYAAKQRRGGLGTH